MNSAILKITRADLDADGYYIGATDVSQPFDGSIEIDGDIGVVRFKTSLKSKYSIRSKAGTSIVSGGSIKARGSIEAGGSIVSGLWIASKWIKARLRIFAGLCSWRMPKSNEMEIRADLRGGTIAFGAHVPPAVEQGGR